MWRVGVVILVCGLTVLGCAPREEARSTEELTVVPDIVERRAQFVPQTLSADVSHLSEGDREALGHLVAAARAMDEIFKAQAWAGNSLFSRKVADLELSLGEEAGQAAKDYYRIMYGPWDRLVHFEPYLGVAVHPDGAGFYPEDMTKEEFEAWLEA
ncbi:MAG: hypothetical protein KAJ97_07020, partial [Acidobacteria bacterium]|nr:hypothetical protein [Acidobacteriota bacterium]